MVPDRVRVLVVAQVRLYRDGLAAGLQAHGTLDVVGTAGSYDEAVNAASNGRPGVVVLDIRVARALHIVRALRERLPSVRIVAFAITEADHEVIQCAEAGVAGY